MKKTFEKAVEKELAGIEKRYVFQFAPRGLDNHISVDNGYALMSEPIEDVSPYDENETIHTALAVHMSDEVKDGRWAQVYRVYWFKEDGFFNPSMISQEDVMVEASEKIFAKPYRKSV